MCSGTDDSTITSAWAEVQSIGRGGQKDVNADRDSDSGGRVLDRFDAMMTEFEVGTPGESASQIDVVWQGKPQ